MRSIFTVLLVFISWLYVFINQLTICYVAVSLVEHFTYPDLFPGNSSTDRSVGGVTVGKFLILLYLLFHLSVHTMVADKHIP